MYKEEPSLYGLIITDRPNLFKKLSYADSTECIERDLIALLLEAMGFVYNEEIADLNSDRVKDIAHQSPIKRVLSHQESRCISYPYVFTWLEKEQPPPYDKTKTDRLNWFLKEVPNAEPTLRNALKEHFQIFSRGLYSVKTDNLIYMN